MKRLKDNVTTGYVAAANKLASKNARRKIVAYVESYDDVFFWRTVLSRFEDETRYFEVMLPTRDKLERGKKSAMMNVIGENVGPDMIACVDADYDYLLQGSSPTSKKILESPYVFHTIVYAIENYQCYAPILQRVCVMATLNDREIFDFKAFLENYSQIIHRLFMWNVWAYTYGRHTLFPLSDFADVVSLDRFNLQHPDKSLNALRQRCNRRMNLLQRQFPEGRQTFRPLCEKLEALGVTPSNTYLYMRGHDLFEHVVGPILEAVCTKLRREREAEIARLAVHEMQKHNELASYQHSCAPWQEMLRKHDFYRRSSLYRQVVQRARDIARQAFEHEIPGEDASSPEHAVLQRQ